MPQVRVRVSYRLEIRYDAPLLEVPISAWGVSNLAHGFPPLDPVLSAACLQGWDRFTDSLA